MPWGTLWEAPGETSEGTISETLGGTSRRASGETCWRTSGKTLELSEETLRRSFCSNS